MTEKTKCLYCEFWLRTRDPLIGRCQVYEEWRGQFEGSDRYGDCKQYRFGEQRAKSAGRIREIVLKNIDQVRAWRVEAGRSVRDEQRRIEINTGTA